MSPDLGAALLLGIGASFVGASYGLRVLAGREIRSARVARAGTSVFLGRSPMEAAYAAFEPLGRALARIGVTANAVTASGVGLSIIAGLFAAFGLLGLAAAVAAIAAAADALDGIVARATTGPTPDGAIYDSAADRYMEFSLIGGLIIHFRDSIGGLVVTLAALCGAFMVSYVSAKSEAHHVEVPRGSMRRGERAVYLVLGSMLAPITVQIVGAPWAYDAPILLALALIAVAANASALSRLLALGRGVAREANQPNSHTLVTPSADPRKPDPNLEVPSADDHRSASQWVH